MKKDRLNIRVDRDLMEWVRWYSTQRGTTITQLVTGYLRRLRDNYTNRHKSDVDQA